MGSHAILSPSSASRWLSCTPSARLESSFPDTTSSAAEEGTLAHYLGELKMQLHLDYISLEKFKLEHAAIKANSYYDAAMENYTSDYAYYCIERYNELKAEDSAATAMLERKVDLTAYVPEGFGTVDFTAVGARKLIIVDLKYGKGVPVSAIENPQLKTYALGALDEWSVLFDIDEVEVHIFQPRIDNTTHFKISAVDLRAWGEEVLRPKAKLAFAGEGEFVAGKHCQFCKIKAQCRTNAEYHLQLAAYDFRAVNLLTPEEISDIIAKSPLFKTWLTSVEEFALTEALKGNAIPGYKIVEGRSTRQITNEDAVVKVLKANGFNDEELFTKKLLGITALEKLAGKQVFNNLLSPYVVKPIGSPTLAPVSDKRQEFNSVDNDFKNC